MTTSSGQQPPQDSSPQGQHPGLWRELRAIPSTTQPFPASRPVRRIMYALSAVMTFAIVGIVGSIIGINHERSKEANGPRSSTSTDDQRAQPGQAVEPTLAVFSCDSAQRLTPDGITTLVGTNGRTVVVEGNGFKLVETYDPVTGIVSDAGSTGVGGLVVVNRLQPGAPNIARPDGTFSVADLAQGGSCDGPGSGRYELLIAAKGDPANAVSAVLTPGGFEPGF